MNKTHSQIAEENFKSGCNCAQAVIAAYADELNVDINKVLKLSSSFGGGMGRLREVCGAVSAMFMVAGLKYGYDDLNDPDAKKSHYELIQKLAEEFKKQNGSIICRELLSLPSGADKPTPEKRTAEFYKKRPCVDLCKCACDILDNNK